MDITTIRKTLENGKLLWTTHCVERMSERDIRRADVKHCISVGEIIEDYPRICLTQAV